MTQLTETIPAAWGLELGQTTASLVRVERVERRIPGANGANGANGDKNGNGSNGNENARSSDGADFHERQVYTGPCDFWRSSLFDAALLAALKQIPHNEPLAVCFPDQAMFCRGFSLPNSPPAVLEKMVQARVDSLLPAGGDRLNWTWQTFADPLDPAMQWILVCATRRNLLERLTAALPANVQLKSLLPRAIAAIQGCPPQWSVSGGQSAGSQPPAPSCRLLIDLSGEAATMALWAEGHLLRCAVLDRDDEIERDSSETIASNASIATAAPPWVWQSRQVYQSLLEGLPRDRWPRHGLLRLPRSANGEGAILSSALGAALGVELSPWPAPPDATGQPINSHDSAAKPRDVVAEETLSPCTNGAVGAARLLLADPADPDSTGVNFARAKQAAAAPAAIHPRRLLTLTAAIFVGVMLLWGIDWYRASWLSRQVEQLRAVESASGGMERRLAIDRYLEKAASPALPGLDAILAAAPPSLAITSFGLSANGQFRLVGMVGGNPGELDGFLRKLQECKALMHVELRSGRSDPQQQQRWTVELTADAAPAAGLLLVRPPTPTAGKPGDMMPPRSPSAADGPSRPATSPSTQPTTTGTAGAAGTTTTRGGV